MARNIDLRAHHEAEPVPASPGRSIGDDSRRARVAATTGTWKFVVGAWAGSRILFLGVGAVGAHFLERVQMALPAAPPGWLSYWGHWDGGWYSAIAIGGYKGPLWPASASFFPTYPALIRTGMLVGGGPAIWGVAISVAAALAALYFLYEITEELAGAQAARAATLSLALFPTTFFLNAAYTEGVFLAAATGSVWAARVRGNFLAAGLLGAVASGTRNVGVFLVIPLVHEWFQHRRTSGARALAAAALVPLGLLSYTFWLWRWSGDPLLYRSAIRPWGRTLTNPIDTLDRAWSAARAGAVWAVHPDHVFASASPDPAFAAMDFFNLIFLVVLVALLIGTAIRLPWGLAAYAAAAALTPVLTPMVSSPLGSLPRLLLAAFPLFIFLGIVLARSRAALAGWLAVNAALGVLLTLYFTTWRWVA